MDGSCPTVEQKITLAQDSACIAKVTAVEEMGIGEDLSFSLFAWRRDRLMAVSQLRHDIMKNKPKRFDSTAHAAAIYRRGWGATGLTFVAEGYCAVDPDGVDNRPFAEQFVNNPAVSECLSIVHADENSINVTAIPYTYEIGRKVRFLTPLKFNLDLSSIEGTIYPEMLARIIVDIAPAGLPKDDVESYLDSLAHALSDFGWTTTYHIDAVIA